MRQALAYTREHRAPFLRGTHRSLQAARLEPSTASPEQALALFDTGIDSLHRGGNVGKLARALAYLAVFFDRQ